MASADDPNPAASERGAAEPRSAEPRKAEPRRVADNGEAHKAEPHKAEPRRVADNGEAVEGGPDSPAKLGKRAWLGVFKRTVKEFNNDNLTDWAAALTYYAVLSIFPGILVLLSVSGLLLTGTTQKEVLDSVQKLFPASIAGPVTGAIDNLMAASHVAGLLAIVGLLGSVWTASGYVGAFMRAANAIYDVPEGRPIWKVLPIRLAITLVVGTLIALAALSIVFSGRFAQQAGSWIGLSKQAVMIFDIVKWPVLLLVVIVILAILYWAAPNARQHGFRWVTPGGALAVFIWLLASGAFAVYVTNFSSYNKTYGTLGGIIAFLVWLWISNIAILLGAEFDAELERSRAIAGGMAPKDKEPYVPLRDDAKIDKDHEIGLS